MLTTIQVRSIISKYGKFSDRVYTNKLKLGSDCLRSVKCYYNGTNDDKLLDELRSLAGSDNVKVTPGTQWGRPGITVKCVLA